MIAFQEMQRGFVLLSKTDAVLEGNDLIIPSMDNCGGAIQQTLAQFREAFHVDCRCQQENAPRMKVSGSGDGNEASKARADEHQVPLQVLAKLDELRDAVAGGIDATKVHGLRLIAFAPRGVRKRGDLATPRPTILTMGEDDVATRHCFLDARSILP